MNSKSLIEENLINYFENAKTKRQKDFIKTENHCALCETVLELQHTVETKDLEITEQSKCPSCDLRTRNKTFTLN